MGTSTPIDKHQEEAEIVADASANQHFKAIYDRDTAGLMRVSRLYGGKDAQDLNQEIALAIWLALKRFRGDSSLRTFAYRIAHNRGISFRNRRVEQQLEDEPLSKENVEKAVLMEQRLAHLFRAILRLPDQTQKIVTLSLEGFTYAEIASVVGCSENNVGVALSRGKKRLGELLAEDGDD